jgi:hypothetical protein
MDTAAAAPAVWSDRRRRAAELRDRYSFAAEVLTLYLALVDVQEQAAEAAGSAGPAEPVSWAAAEVAPRVVATSVEAGPALLAEAAAARLHGGGVEDVLTAWLRGGGLEPADRYLARATMGPLLEALPGVRALCAAEPGGCPACGGPPQLSWLGASGESLVAGRRSLLCARCHASWTVPRAACAGCGELITVHAERSTTQPEPAVFPHLRIEGCEHCDRYVLGVDLGRDARAVPEVDELAAIPLALYAVERGFTKLTPNLMGM